MMFLERYKTGQHKEVWDELVGLGEQVWDAKYFDDAWAVALETMERVKYNVETIYHRLLSINYRFLEPQQAYIPVSQNVDKEIGWIESLAGHLPLSLRAWLKIVGNVDFRGSHPELASFYLASSDQSIYPEFLPYQTDKNFPYCGDPLLFDNAEDVLERIDHYYPDVDEYFLLDVPNWSLKSNLEGGGYCLRLPNHYADVALEDEPHQTTFVDYLRVSFQWGGFPGFHLHSAPEFEMWRHKWKVASEYSDTPFPHEILKFLSEGLLSI